MFYYKNLCFRFTPTSVGNTLTFSMALYENSVHPHECGEYDTASNNTTGSIGSPPRVWGILGVLLSMRAYSRFTPTSVGNTTRGGRDESTTAVHPHECGEYHGWSNIPIWSSGSPPRVWGIRHIGQPESYWLRFTPTSVGNTSSAPVPAMAATVHPHECGEYSANDDGDTLVFGSPPRVWGIRARAPVCAALLRFTPTSVGNTVPAWSISISSTVHPHECGEYFPDVERCTGNAVHPHECGEYPSKPLASCVANGSPPRVWGIRYRAHPKCPLLRFTPTSVGNTLIHRHVLERLAVHPHECGEYLPPFHAQRRPYGSPPRVWGIRDVLTLVCLDYGSPPRVWGIRHYLISCGKHERFTPTSVGNTRLFECQATGHAVHPHECGEYGLH